MATLIRSPRVGEPKRIVTSFRRTAIPTSEPAVIANNVEPDENSSSSQLEDAVTPIVTNATAPSAAETAIEEEVQQAAFQLQHARERAEKAEQRLETIESQLNALREEARLQGYKEGQQDGHMEGRAAVDELAQSFITLLASLESQRRNLLENNEDQWVEVVYTAVTRILGESLACEVGARQVVLQVLRQVIQRDVMIVRVAPHDHAMLLGLSDELLKQSQATAVEIIPDEKVELGGCILETTVGSLDGRLEVQLNSFKEALLTTRARRRAEAEATVR